MTLTQGNWRGVYGADGYVVIADQTSNPSYVTPAASGQSQAVWASSTSDARALQKASNPSVRIAAPWYTNSGSFTVDLNMSDSNVHQVAVYCLDWDTTARRETVAITDASGNVLNSQSLTSSFNGGVYLVWNVSGHVKVQVTLAGGANAVISGLFFDGGASGVGSTYVTTYTYDILNHLTGVSMTRGATTQTRTFNYANGSTVGALLLSATNPENGTVSYTYNTDMTLATKTDAKGQVFSYSYDGYKRLTQVSVGAAVLRNYVYDSNPDDSSYSGPYTAGRLTEIKYPAILYSASPGGPQASTTFTDMFSYTQAGALAGKRLRVTKTNPYQNQQGQWVSQTGVGDLNLAYSYNNEGKPTQIVYAFDAASGNSPTYNCTYDAMARLNGMTGTDNGGVSNVSYGPANELLSINYYGATETRTYNSLLQLTNISATVQGGTGINLTYNYTGAANNGKIAFMTDALSGETVAYQYDSLNRLISAAGSRWTQTQSYDGFGNLTGRVGTGTAQSTTMSTPADAATNRLSGYSYDANGNLLSTGNVYDAENRLAFANISGGMVEYFYDAQNKRVWQGNCTLGGNCQQGVVTTDTITLFGADGRQVATYQWSAPWNNTQTQVAITFQAQSRRAYFGGKLVAQSQSGVMPSAVQDRLGSVGKYYPYGEERNSPQLPNDQVKFATYTRDAGTGLDYADQRYYASTFGRFVTPDPYKASGGPSDPGSWNRYVYVTGDPVNYYDP